MDREIEVRKMECKEIRVDVRTASIKESTEGQRQTKILFQINHTMPFTDEYNHLLKELFGNNLGDESMYRTDYRYPMMNGKAKNRQVICFANSSFSLQERDFGLQRYGF